MYQFRSDGPLVCARSRETIPPSYDDHVKDCIDSVTEEMWEHIGEELTRREKSGGRYIPAEWMADHIDDIMDDFREKCQHEGKPQPDAAGLSPYGSITDIKGCGQAIGHNDIFKCLYSANAQFSKGKEYRLRLDVNCTEGLYLFTESGKKLYINGHWAPIYIKTFFVLKQASIVPEIKVKLSMKKNRTIKCEREDDMSLSQKSINRLNGLKVGEERLVELTQESSEKKTKTFDLVKLLQKTEAFGKLKAGKDCLVQSIDVSGDKLRVTVLEGEVDREKTEAILAALQSKLLSDDGDDQADF